jgi:hypothetical protein
MARGIHGLLTVSAGPAMPKPKGLMAVSGVAYPQGGQPAAIFYPLGYPNHMGLVFAKDYETKWVRNGINFSYCIIKSLCK